MAALAGAGVSREAKIAADREGDNLIRAEQVLKTWEEQLESARREARHIVGPSRTLNVTKDSLSADVDAGNAAVAAAKVAVEHATAAVRARTRAVAEAEASEVHGVGVSRPRRDVAMCELEMARRELQDANAALEAAQARRNAAADLYSSTT
jgi:hypothetical protein